MIRLKEPGERAGELTVTMTPFDLLSLQEACMDAWLYRREKGDMPKRVEAHKQNYEELERVKQDREKELT